ncbi:MAG: exodeoxyribonuclease VII small subunit [Chloroflexi bacterium]|nr:exodeoxyribonuclease VII small subunit [Chloroflexota bacterium]
MPDATNPAQTTTPAPQPKNFEESFSRLEETVRALEAGKLSLDEATKLFEQGMALAKRCNELLSAAELKVTRLQSAFAEQMRFLQDNGAGLEEQPDSRDPGA